MNSFKDFMSNYGGAVIGAIVAILILCTQLYQLFIWIILICIGIYIGNYIQHNKYEVKEKLKKIIDKL